MALDQEILTKTILIYKFIFDCNRKSKAARITYYFQRYIWQNDRLGQ